MNAKLRRYRKIVSGFGVNIRIEIPVTRSPLWSPDTEVLGFSSRFHWIRVNERPIRKECTRFTVNLEPCKRRLNKEYGSAMQRL